MLTPKEVADLLEYDSETGVFIWKKRRGGKAKIGSIAGTIDSKGYRQIIINGTAYLAHRLAWFICKKEWPSTHLDHRDRNPLNNSIDNLRPCTRAQNHQNIRVRSNNSSGVTGVSFNKKSGFWLAYINTNGKRHRIGLFEKFDDAVAARIIAKRELHTFQPEQAFGAQQGVEFHDYPAMEAA